MILPRNSEPKKSYQVSQQTSNLQPMCLRGKDPPQVSESSVARTLSSSVVESESSRLGTSSVLLPTSSTSESALKKEKYAKQNKTREHNPQNQRKIVKRKDRENDGV